MNTNIETLYGIKSMTYSCWWLAHEQKKRTLLLPFLLLLDWAFKADRALIWHSLIAINAGVTCLMFESHTKNNNLKKLEKQSTNFLCSEKALKLQCIKLTCKFSVLSVCSSFIKANLISQISAMLSIHYDTSDNIKHACQKKKKVV